MFGMFFNQGKIETHNGVPILHTCFHGESLGFSEIIIGITIHIDIYPQLCDCKS